MTLDELIEKITTSIYRQRDLLLNAGFAYPTTVLVGDYVYKALLERLKNTYISTVDIDMFCGMKIVTSQDIEPNAIMVGTMDFVPMEDKQ